MVFVLAEAKTSAGAPDVICIASAELAAKLSVTFTPGLALSNCWPSVVNASVSDAAANTVIDPDNDGDAEVGLAALDEPSSPDPQPASPTATRTVARMAMTKRRMTTPQSSLVLEVSESSGFPRRRWWLSRRRQPAPRALAPDRRRPPGSAARRCGTARPGSPPGPSPRPARRG